MNKMCIRDRLLPDGIPFLQDGITNAPERDISRNSSNCVVMRPDDSRQSFLKNRLSTRNSWPCTILLFSIANPISYPKERTGQ